VEAGLEMGLEMGGGRWFGARGEGEAVDGCSDCGEAWVAWADEEVDVHVGMACQVGEVPYAEGFGDPHHHVEAGGILLPVLDLSKGVR
jgi:hypothetical protein